MGIGALGCGTLGGDLTFYLPEPLGRLRHEARGAASCRAACAVRTVRAVCTARAVCTVRAVCTARLYGLSAPSSETQPGARARRPPSLSWRPRDVGLGRLSGAARPQPLPLSSPTGRTAP